MSPGLPCHDQHNQRATSEGRLQMAAESTGVSPMSRISLKTVESRGGGATRVLLMSATAALMIVGAVVSSATSAAAVEAKRVTDSVHVSFPLPYYTQLCGFPVTFELAGRI